MPDRLPRPAPWTSRHDEGELLLEPAQALKRILDRIDPFLKDDLLRSMIELLSGEPAPMRQRPMAAAAVNPAVPEQEGQQLLALPPQIVSRRLTGANKVPDRLVSRVGRPHPCQFAGPMQACQRNRIPPVRLDPLARLVSGSAPERPPCSRGPSSRIWRYSPYPVGPASKQTCSWSYRPASLLIISLDRRRAVLDVAEKPNLSLPAPFRDRHRVLLLRDIESHKDFAILLPWSALRA